jgi:competence protein ComEC
MSSTVAGDSKPMALNLVGRATMAATRAAGSAVREEIGNAERPVWLVVSMILGAATWFSLDGAVPLVAIILLLVAAFGWLVFTNGHLMMAAALLVCGVLAGMLAADLETRRAGTILLDGPVTTTLDGRVVGRNVDHRGRWRYTIDRIKTAEPRLRRPPTRVRLVAMAAHDPVPLGQGIAGRARLRPPSGPVLPGAYDFSFHAYFEGIGAHGFFLGRPRSAASASGGEGGWREFGDALARLREAIAQRIRSVLPGDAGRLAVALTVAERRSVDPDLIEALRASGLAHILAISGLHMTLVAGTFFYFLRACFSLFPAVVHRLPVKKFAAGGALLVATAYLLISGASVSTRRAFIMLAIMMIAVLLDRRALTMRNVAFAAIVIVLITPSAVLGPGFQMSFAATAALIAVFELWNRYRADRAAVARHPARDVAGGIVLFFAGLALTSLVAGLATAPFAVFHFNRIATHGLLANLAAMPIVTFIVMPAGLFAVLAMPLGLEKVPMLVMGKGLDLVIAIARHVEDLGGAVVVGRTSHALFATTVAGLVLFVLARTRLRLAGLAMLVGAFLTIGWTAPARGPDLVISEDGSLVGLVSGTMVATNRLRPPGFVLEQWQRILGGLDHEGPRSVPAGETGAEPREILRSVQKALTGGFFCVPKRFCAAVTPGGQRIVSVEDLAYLGIACDHADLVVTAKPVVMPRCYSGAMLVTGRMLPQTGALEIEFRKDGPAIRTAIASTDRAWTRHRTWDWRSRSFRPLSIGWLGGGIGGP